jgi:hypothetical protein
MYELTEAECEAVAGGAGERVTKLERDGNYDAAAARGLLRIVEELQEMHVAHRARLVKEPAKRALPSGPNADNGDPQCGRLIDQKTPDPVPKDRKLFASIGWVSDPALSCLHHWIGGLVDASTLRGSSRDRPFSPAHRWSARSG